MARGRKAETCEADKACLVGGWGEKKEAGKAERRSGLSGRRNSGGENEMPPYKSLSVPCLYYSINYYFVNQYVEVIMFVLPGPTENLFTRPSWILNIANY